MTRRRALIRLGVVLMALAFGPLLASGAVTAHDHATRAGYYNPDCQLLALGTLVGSPGLGAEAEGVTVEAVTVRSPAAPDHDLRDAPHEGPRSRAPPISRA